MIKYLLPKLKSSRIIDLIERFFKSPFYVVLMGLVTLFSVIFGIEIYAYWFYIIVAGWIPWLFCSDLTSALVPICYGYITFSYQNNNQNTDGLFNNEQFMKQFIFLVVNSVVILLSRLIIDLIFRKKKIKFPKLSIGLFFLLVSFVIGGIFTSYYDTKSIIFGLVLGSIMLVFYLIAYLEIDWDNFNFSYIAWIFMVMGIVVSFELGYTYYRVIYIDKVENFSRNYLTLGWGFYNNIGLEIAFSIPSILYLFKKYNKGYLSLIPFTIVLVALIFSQSRGAIIFGGLSIIITFVITFIFSNKKKRFELLFYLIGIILLSLLALIIFNDKFKDIFNTLINTFEKEGLNAISSNRMSIYKKGLEDFLIGPIFGVGFSKCDAYIYINMHTSFFPARYHNTYIELLAATGLFGTFAYIFHRYQTVKIAVKNKNMESIYIMLSILCLLLTSLVDNHFFNIGPNIQYAILLATLEGISLKGFKNENN